MYRKISGPLVLINTQDDMQWLKDVHIPNLNLRKFKSAMVHGNEDAPDLIEVFEKRDPNVSDTPVQYIQSEFFI